MVREFSLADGHTLLAIEDAWIKTRHGVAVSFAYLFIYLFEKKR